jgi:hypothetical protein
VHAFGNDLGSARMAVLFGVFRFPSRFARIAGSYRAVSSRGQDTWFSATGPGFESPYRYQIPTSNASVSSEDFRGGVSTVGEALID